MSHERLMHEAIANDDWDKAISHASNIPPNWDIWQQMPSAKPMPSHAIKKVLQVLNSPYGRFKDNKTSFLYELAHNLPEDIDSETLNHIHNEWLKHSQEIGPDYLTEKQLISHPNFKPDESTQNKMKAAAFWTGYAKKVEPHHFATVQSMYENKPITLTDHRGAEGKSQDELIPHLKEYAKSVQDAILNDKNIQKRNFGGKPYIKVYRGVNGHYGRQIRDHVGYNPQTGEKQDKKFTIPTAHLTSWSTDKDMAGRFAWRSIDGQPTDQGVVLSQWMPVENALHSGFHHVVPNQEHPNNEAEIVFGHPEGKVKVSTKDMHFQETPKYAPGSSTPDNYGKLTKSEEDLFKSKPMAALATAFAMASAPAAISNDIYQHVASNHPAQIESVTQAKPQKVSPHPDLKAIEYIESTGGKNTKHVEMKSGPHKGMSAFGRYGLMPMQISDTVNYDKKLKNKYKDLAQMDYKQDHNKIKNYLAQNPHVEVEIANSHWKRLKNMFGDEHRAAYAWLNGIGGAKRASPEDIDNHYYVQKYKKYKTLQSLEDVKKSESIVDKEEPQQFLKVQGKYNTGDISEINKAIQAGEVYDLSNSGHFTHKSFIAGKEEGHSWLIKVEEKGQSSIKSVQNGLQAVKEAAFYAAAQRVFRLEDWTPQAILGEVLIKDAKLPAAAIKMYDDVFVPAAELESRHPHVVDRVLTAHVESGIIHKLSAMLYILGDADAHGNNVLTNGSTFKTIDHGSSFADSSFDPSKDEDIFIPYLLRGPYIDVDKMEKEEVLAALPELQNEKTIKEVNFWLYNLDFYYLKDILEDFCVDPMPCLKRLIYLQKLTTLTGRADMVVNRVWVYGEGEKK